MTACCPASNSERHCKYPKFSFLTSTKSLQLSLYLEWKEQFPNKRRGDISFWAEQKDKILHFRYKLKPFSYLGIGLNVNKNKLPLKL